VFAPKYRRKVFYAGAYAGRDITEDSSIKLHGFLERKEQPANIREAGKFQIQVRSREFWCKGYYVDTTGKNTTKITEYIKKHLKEDDLGDRLPFDGDPFKKSVGSRMRQAVKKVF
jgi:putative transposase